NMKKNIEYKLRSNEVISVEVSTHDEFLSCKELVASPFQTGKLFVSPEIDINSIQKIVIKCFIQESERLKIVSSYNDFGQSICNNIVEQFIQENWPDKNKLLPLETLNCNHYEQQYKYAIL